VRLALPLAIDRADWNNPHLAIGGASRSFNALFPVRVFGNGGVLLVGSDEQDFGRTVGKFVGPTVSVLVIPEFFYRRWRESRTL
jgi:hypothetical protein